MRCSICEKSYIIFYLCNLHAKIIKSICGVELFEEIYEEIK